MVEVKLILRGTKGSVIIKGSSFADVLSEYERNKLEVDKTLGGISVVRPTSKVPSSIPSKSIQGRISSLAADGFFVASKTADEVREQLKQRGYAYPIDRVSIALIRMVRKKELRRFTEKKENKEVYVYVNP